MRPERGNRSRALRPLVLASLAALFAGCGGASSSGVAHLSSKASAAGAATNPSGSSNATSEGAPGPGSLEASLLAFAKCMRSNGVPDFPDPSGTGGFPVSRRLDRSSPVFRAAQAKCKKFQPDGGPLSGPPPSAQTLARFLKIAECMRRNGVPEFPDPRTSAPSDPATALGGRPGVISNIEGVILVFPGTLDEQSPQFTRAAARCAFPLHNH